MYLQFGTDGIQEQFASNRGWSDFITWADGLDPAKYPELLHLCDHGWSQNLDDLEKELAVATDKEPPEDENVGQTLAAIAESMQGRDYEDVVGVTNGMQPSDNDVSTPVAAALSAKPVVVKDVQITRDKTGKITKATITERTE